MISLISYSACFNSLIIFIDRFVRLDIMFLGKHLEKLNWFLKFLIPNFRGSLDCINRCYHGIPLEHLNLLEILYRDKTMIVNLLITCITIEELVFVWAFLMLADIEASCFITDAA
jgi:hypothetical protein